MDKINFNEILIKHLILFDYDTDKSIKFIEPHHLFKIEDSIHYKSLISENFEDYEKLISTTNQKEHSKELFLNLKKNFNKNQLTKEENKITLKYNQELNKFIVEDGCHRLSILMLENKKELLPLEWFKIKNIK